MEVNAEEGVVKYSKLIEDNAKMDYEPSLILYQDSTLNHQNVKNKQPKDNSKTKVAFKTLIGLSLFLLLIVIGLVAGVFAMDVKVQRLNQQNQDLVQTAKHLQARNQSLSHDLENMKDALNVSKVEIESLKQDIQELMVQNQKLIKDIEVENQNHYKEQDWSKTALEDLRLQNQTLIIYAEKI